MRVQVPPRAPNVNAADREKYDVPGPSVKEYLKLDLYVGRIGIIYTAGIYLNYCQPQLETLIIQKHVNFVLNRIRERGIVQSTIQKCSENLKSTEDVIVSHAIRKNHTIVWESVNSVTINFIMRVTDPHIPNSLENYSELLSIM